jgi:hypothetical protein
MRDVELILRFLAIYYNFSKYEKPMKEFLNSFMRRYRRPPPKPDHKESDKKKNAAASELRAFEKKMQEFSSLFTRTARAVNLYLKGKPFHIKRGLNAAVFDSVFVAFAEHFGKSDIAKPTAAQASHLDSRFQQLLKDSDYGVATTSGTTDDVMIDQRLKKASAILFH